MNSRRVWSILSKLKDHNIKLNWKALDLEEFYILGPIDYNIKEDEEGNQIIYAECINYDLLEYFTGSDGFRLICDFNPDKTIKSINNKDPFEYINNFGGNFLSTKNVHGTFSFKLRYNNNVPLSDYPLSLGELENLKIEFYSGKKEYTTEYLIASDLDIYARLRNLEPNNKNISKKNFNKFIKNTRQNIIRNKKNYNLRRVNGNKLEL